MISRMSQNEESWHYNHNKPTTEETGLISIVCILYFVIAYSVTGLLLMTSFHNSNFMDMACFLLFASILIFLVQLVTICSVRTVETRYKVGPQYYENENIQKFDFQLGVFLPH